MVMSEYDSLLVLCVGVPLSFLAIWLNRRIPGKSITEEPRAKKSGKTDDRRRLEYETLTEERRRRSETIISIAGTVFVISSFAVLAQSAFLTSEMARLSTALAALGLYSFWLFVYAYTSAWLDAVISNKLCDLEEELGLVAHRYIQWRIHREFAKWIRLRQTGWPLLLLFETIVAACIVLHG